MVYIDITNETTETPALYKAGTFWTENHFMKTEFSSALINPSFSIFLQNLAYLRIKLLTQKLRLGLETEIRLSESASCRLYSMYILYILKLKLCTGRIEDQC
jgi:hypothetical protein